MTDIPASFERELFLKHIAVGGMDPQKAAEAISRETGKRYTASAFRRQAGVNPEFAAQIAEAQAVRADKKMALVDDRVEELALGEEPAPAIVNSWAKRWHPGYRETQRLEVDVAARITTTAEVPTLGDILDLAAELGIERSAIAAGSRPALPGPEAILPPQSESEADDLSAAGES